MKTAPSSNASFQSSLRLVEMVSERLEAPHAIAFELESFGARPTFRIHSNDAGLMAREIISRLQANERTILTVRTRHPRTGQLGSVGALMIDPIALPFSVAAEFLVLRETT